jgi:hypothetical protein
MKGVQVNLVLQRSVSHGVTDLCFKRQPPGAKCTVPLLPLLLLPLHATG